MTTREVADKLVALCRQGEHLKAQDELYHSNIVSVEADGSEVKGIAATKAKGQEFFQNAEIHGGDIPAYYVGHNSFSVVFEVDITPQGGTRMKLAEIGVYTVAKGKIVHEQFQSVAD